jgi:hypothetical protein
MQYAKIGQRPWVYAWARCNGKIVTFDQIADTLEQFTGKKTEFQCITTDSWMERIYQYIDPEGTLPRGASPEDATAFTFRKFFGA